MTSFMYNPKMMLFGKTGKVQMLRNYIKLEISHNIWKQNLKNNCCKFKYFLPIQHKPHLLNVICNLFANVSHNLKFSQNSCQ